jgi:hypothetical protein
MAGCSPVEDAFVIELNGTVSVCLFEHSREQYKPSLLDVMESYVEIRCHLTAEKRNLICWIYCFTLNSDCLGAERSSNSSTTALCAGVFLLNFAKLFLTHPALPLEVSLNRNYRRQNSAWFATLWEFKTLYMSPEYICIRFQSCKALFETPCI